MKKFLAAAIAALVFATALTGCSQTGGKTSSSSSESSASSASTSTSLSGGKLVMATNAEFTPFEFVSENGVVGQFDGIDIVIAQEIAKSMGKELEVSNMDFTSILPAIASGKADMAIAGMSVKPDRLENADFSDPYWTAVQTIIVKKDNTDITSVATLKGKKIGVVTSYTGDTAITDKGYEPQRYQKGVDAIMDLKNGKLDAVVIDSPTANSFIAKNTELKGISDSVFEKEEYAIAVKKGNTELLNKINSVIKELKASGKIDQIAAEVDARLSSK